MRNISMKGVTAQTPLTDARTMEKNMSEEMKNNATEGTETEKKQEAPVEDKKAGMTAEELISKGRIALETPITARDKELTEICYDFTKVTGLEYLDAMDADPKNQNAFRISQKQAFFLFAKAAAKATGDVDEIDLRQRMGKGDVMNAVRIATAFFMLMSRSANKRICSAL